jgi:hypothetical protein
VTTLLQLATTAWLAAPSPSPTPEFDENLVTPGVIGFAITFLVAAVTILLIVDMTRRIRRVRYRGELRERLEQQAPESPTAPED